MSVDRRNPATDATATIGTILDETSKRDAIHIAVEPVIAGETLYPGQTINLFEGKAYHCSYADSVGIVDPFLRERIFPDQRFWLVIHPRTITSLRHVWEHPYFDDKASLEALEENASKEAEAVKEIMIDAAKERLRILCGSWNGPDYRNTIEFLENDADDYYNDEYDYGLRIDGEYLYSSGDDAHGAVPEEFWEIAEIIVGRDIRPKTDTVYFTCSC